MPAFDLLVWWSPKILVLEFSPIESGETELKHRLANNILRALWPSEFKGCELYQHRWPISGVDGSQKSATDWLLAMISGFGGQQKTPVWAMGEEGLGLLFPEQPDLGALIGSLVPHPQLNIDILVSSGLGEMLKNPVAKAQAWQLLKPYR